MDHEKIYVVPAVREVLNRYAEKTDPAANVNLPLLLKVYIIYLIRR